ncbi:nucleotide-binding protein [Natronincola ferrireducens]|uniref:Chromosome partitioning ATPase, Mrp family, contains Fe-S cluster n=1 Tax=Natronincola ferrireducens TaxID=393762 RepID=A0A1G9J1D5_9FIRM|nr:ATP-binding protein [Natronincola ferrireducens]SDL31318.1 Chromosome partitioning ATPase, Mrp family, contains Fe-S cluster [Natronincola ferrireducens]
MLKDHRIRIIIGHYGSGKTEFAVNYAVNLAKEGKKVALADLDIVNPYFRSREKEDLLEGQGIKVIASYIKGSGSDLPAVTGDVLAPLQDKTYDVVLDVGGDSVGARALARYKEYWNYKDYDMFCVVNANRFETTTVEGVLQHIEGMEAASGAKVTGLINNTHLLRHTTVEEVLKGQELCEKVGNVLNIPIKYISVLEEITKDLPSHLEGTIMPIKMMMREDWM